MAQIDKRIKVKKLNTGSETLVLPEQSKGNQGNVGKFYEKHLADRGFSMNDGQGVDIPDLNIENKTRNRDSKASHTVGTMTYDNIINTPYEKSTICQKLQQQNRMEYDNTFNVVTNESVYDFRDTDIQQKLKESYENARNILRQQGGPAPGTVVGGEYGVFEWKSGNTYAHRIPDSGMKKLKNMAKSTFNDLFDIK
jgi:hypothetical protein